MIDELISNVVVAEESGCWEWQRALLDGYGIFYGGDKNYFAHRLCWELVEGPIPVGKVLDHLCLNRKCINPGHLEVTTQRDNLLRSDKTQASINIAKSHCPRGHELVVGNLVAWDLKKGRRSCRTCARERAKRHSKARQTGSEYVPL